jgi:hypothetical protein
MDMRARVRGWWEQFNAWLLRDYNARIADFRRLKTRLGLVETQGRVVYVLDPGTPIGPPEAYRNAAYESIWDGICAGLDDPPPLTYSVAIGGVLHVVYRYVPARPQPPGAGPDARPDA